MEDPVEINRRIERLLKRVRRRDDYGELLFSGEVIRSCEGIDDPDECRAEIRKKARADRIKVRTGEIAGKVWALVNAPRSSDVLLEGRRFFALADRALGEAESCGHEARVALRDGEEALVKCDGCSALGYLDASASMVGGSILEEDCQGGGLPGPDSSPAKDSVVLLHLLVRRPRRGPHFDRVVEEVGRADSVFEQVDVGT